MEKGDLTKKKILDTGFGLASKTGLECLSIGKMANLVKMSKSGLFGHFNSKENLQLEVMKHAGDIFNRDVIVPALKTKPGIPRIQKMMDNWIEWTMNLSGGCIFVAAAAEYSDRPGLVRDSIKKQHDLWIDCLNKIALSAVKQGDFKKDSDCNLFAFQMYSLILGFFLYHNSLGYKQSKKLLQSSFLHLIDSYKL